MRPGIELGIDIALDLVGEMLMAFKVISVNNKILEGIVHETARTLLPALAEGPLSNEMICHELL
jgi:hypothetical protein